MKDNIVLIDICGTLYNSNTTFDFLDYYLKSKNYLLFRKVSKSFIWKLVNKILLILFNYDLTRRIVVMYLNNKTILELSDAVDLFYKDVLVNLENRDSFSLLNEFKSKGYRVILTSATLDFIAKRVSIATGVQEFLSTDLFYQNDICVGKIKNDLLFKKLEYLISKKIIPPYEFTMSDNFTDIPLFENSHNNIIITNSKNVIRWNSLILSKKISNSEIRIV